MRFEEELEKLQKLNRDDYFFYAEYFAQVNEILKANPDIKIPLDDTFIVKFKHYTDGGCNEVGAYTENNKKYNVGIPIIDTIESIFMNHKLHNKAA